MAGASHFLEHLLFKGTTNRTPRDINRSVDAVGGEFNAFTNKESTVFHLRVPASARDVAADLLADVISRPRLDPDDVELERGVILEELALAADSPDDLVYTNLVANLYPGHPLGREVLGSPDSLRTMSRTQIAEFHQEWYRPGNLVVAAAGDVDHDELVEVFAALEVDGGAPPQRTDPAPSLRPLTVASRDAEAVHLAMGWHTVGYSHDDRFALAVLSHVLGDGPSSRLYEELREHRGLVYGISAGASLHQQIGQFSVHSGTAPHQLAEVLGIIDDVIGEVVAEGITAEELVLSQGYLRGSLEMSLEDSGSRMSRIGGGLSTRGRITPLAEQLERFAAVTLDDVQRVAGDVFGGPRVVSAVGPVDESAFDVVS